jgi:mannose-6-phosphate isomerase-like protein (cupin superfamily)
VIQVGFELTDFRTGTHTRVIEGPDETDGRGWTTEITCPAGAAPYILEHLHAGWTETFHVLKGRAFYQVDGKKVELSAGESITTPPGHKHVHPWNAGDEVMVFRQVVDCGKRSPDALHDVIGVFATLNGLAKEGKVNGKGLPKNPLQFATTLRTLVKHEGFDAAAPVGAQRLLAATLGRVGEMMGYKAVDPRYVSGDGS